MNDSKRILEVKDLTIHYFVDKSVVKAVNGISFELDQGESLGLVGETGAGKTTTALGIMRLVPNPPGRIVSGSILYKGEDLTKKSEEDMRRIRGHEISMIFQDPMTALNPVLTVGDQIAEVVSLHQNVTKKEALRKAMEMMEMVGIEGERCNEYPHQFSGGMQQRIVIAIALACNPSLLLADEPTTALDVTIQEQVLHLIETLKKRFGTSLILITHDLGVVAEVCDRVGIVYAGQIVEYGTLEHIYNRTAHPYTLGLFGSIPNFDKKVRRLKPIAGLMPDPANLPSGCVFAERCPNAREACRCGDIPVTEIESGHFVRCLNFVKEGK
ncbi:MAG: ABC transporter ATP-binding protein [Pyramidobacter sp.]|nr:ABC transporter ATP-binding protein [Pyramidobacter sp.]MBP3751825.1 ABC transporter ATP-binding protein [Pyramidobacter sp.]MBP3848369.1 ABC transporter ATP-binding protein [Pyramidobacter sp.]